MTHIPTSSTAAASAALPLMLAAALATSAATLSVTPAPAFAQEAITTVEFYSPAVERTMKYNIVLPYAYEDSEVSYPVLYLLHGGQQNFQMWGGMGVPFYAGMYNVIVVMPDGGNTWWVNWAETESGRKDDWEDHIIQDVVGHVDANFRTIAQREGRAITGLSMGGFGAVALGLRHPDMFVSVGSTSGALAHARQEAEKIRSGAPLGARRERSDEPIPGVDIQGFSTPAERTPVGREFLTAEDADAHDPFTLIERLPADRIPHIYLDSGTEDQLIEVAREFAGVLIQKDLPFDFMQMQGRHNGEYWTRALGRILPVQYEVMRRALGERPVAVRVG